MQSNTLREIEKSDEVLKEEAMHHLQCALS